MATIKYKKEDGTYESITNYNIQPITPVQEIGNSVVDVMSQKAVTQELHNKANTKHQHETSDIQGLDILNERTYTLDFGTSSELIQDFNTVGDITITNINIFNVNRIFITYDDKIKEDITNTLNNEININNLNRIVWEIERINDEELACVGVKYIINDK